MSQPISDAAPCGIRMKLPGIDRPTRKADRLRPSTILPCNVRAKRTGSGVISGDDGFFHGAVPFCAHSVLPLEQ